MGATQSTNHPHILNTRLGKLKGIEQRDKLGNPICHRYLKVPYARPPIGQLRWRRPQPLPDSFSFNDPSGSPGDYTRFGPICPQPHYPTDKVEVANPSAAPPIDNIQSEDCLYLNIWIPARPPPPNGWPIQFYLHGGWLQVGDASQDHDTDPFDLLAASTPRIIVSPTYRLNLFGFLAGSDLASCSEDPAPSNYGFWDQRCALEWTHKHISLFAGDPSNITLGGLSAGANSTFFQLYYDTHLPSHQRLIKRIYLWSNAVAIQPAPSTSANLTTQFNDLCTAHDISTSLPASEKLSRLRSIPSEQLIPSIPRLKLHTFRASTDNAFISPTFLSSLRNGDFTTLLARHDISIMLGEVKDEFQLYKFVNPPSSRSALSTQLQNYYPEPVVAALLASSIYTLPPADCNDSDAWATVFAKIVADGQVHASQRGLVHLLLNPPTKPDAVALPVRNVYRYRICFRAKGLDAWVKPEVGVCHGADAPIWWMSGCRAGWTEEDKEKVARFLEPFGEFLYGRPVNWGSKEGADGGEGEDRLRLMDEEGVTHEDVRDEDWERGMKVVDVIWKAQEQTVLGSGESML